MRITFFSFLLLTLTIFSCTNPTTTETIVQPVKRTVFQPVTLADSIAYAHGFDHWQDVQQIDFRFDVDVNGEGKVQREWSWYPKTDSVVRKVAGVSESIIRNSSIDSVQLQLDSEFINDSYWLLMPYYLVWSQKGYTSSTERNVPSPLSDEPRTMLSIQYNQNDGYTPGDAYDLYVDADHQLKEWVFRRGGQAEATMTMNWSDYRTIENLVLPADHRGNGPVRIYHPVVRVITKS